MQAIILAAGMGKRLGNLTERDTKCMLNVNGKKLIERSLDILAQFDLSRVIIVVGFAGIRLKNFLGNSYKGMAIEYVENPIYDKTNNIYSLYLARDYFKREDTLLLESDLIYEKEIIDRLINHPFPNLATVDKYESWMDGTVVTLDDSDNILSFVPKKNFEYANIPNYYKTVNIYKFSREFITKSYLPFLDAYSSAMGRNEYYEQVLRVLLTLEQQELKALRLKGEKWYEIDDVQDLNNAEVIFASPKQKLEVFKKRFGGYWRYPKVRDFCYLVNPYFPPLHMQDEMKYYFKELLAQYPSGQQIQKLLASKMFKCRPDQILVGNGAAELILGLLSDWSGKVGVIYPTFNEYPERMKKAEIVSFIPNNEDFSYDVEDLKNFSEGVDSLLLINPDNPSGNFIPRTDVLDLIEFLEARGKMLILDESFVDFSDKSDANSLIDGELMDRYKNIVIIKSISKSYGVPGARLGVVTTSNQFFLKRIDDCLSIWNINSFGEFFFQIIGKYEEDYTQACQQIAEERDLFFETLKGISFLRPIPSQANYFLCEVKAPWTASELVRVMLNENDIFLKDCTGKVGFENKEFIRISMRNKADIDVLVQALIAIEKEALKHKECIFECEAQENIV